MKRKLILTLLIIFLCSAISGLCIAQGLPTSVITITKEDLIQYTPEGKKVTEINERLRKIAEDTQKLEKGSELYNAGKALFDKVKEERDEVGEPIRGLKNLQITLYGSAVSSPQEFKKMVIEYFTTSPGWKDGITNRMVHGYYAKKFGDENVPWVNFSPPNPNDVKAEKAPQVSSDNTLNNGVVIITNRCLWEYYDGGGIFGTGNDQPMNICKCYDDKGNAHNAADSRCSR